MDINSLLHLFPRCHWILFYRLLTPTIFFYIGYLFYFRLSAGTLPIWSMLFFASLLLSFEPIYLWFFHTIWLKNLFYLGLIFFVSFLCLIFIFGHTTTMTHESDYIIVLGASVKGETMSRTLASRAQKAYEYLSLHKSTIAILSGGQGPGEDISEAEAMFRFLSKKGISDNRLILEEASTNTKENIQYSFALLDPFIENPQVTVISDSFHILRSRLVALKQGKRANGIGSKTVIYLAPNYYLREFFALFGELFR